DGVQLPADPNETVSGDDRTRHPAGHSDGVESQSRQRLACRGRRRAGRRHRRRRLSIAAATAIVRHGRRAGLDAAAGVFRVDRAGRADADREYRVPLSRGVGACDMRDTVTPVGAAIHLQDVSKVFGKAGSEESYRAVDGLDLDVRPGQMLALLGKTGCGKSTIFNMIAGLTEPTSGTVRVSGRDPFAEFDSFRGKMAIVFQSDRLLPWRTAIQNVELGLEM